MTKSLSRPAWVGLLGLLFGVGIGFWGARFTASAPPANGSGDQDARHPAPTPAPALALAPAPRPVPASAPTRVLLPIRAYQQTTSYTCGPASILTLLARKHRKNTGRKVSGAGELGYIDKKGRKDGPPDVSGVSTKPLNDTGLAIATLSHEVTQ